MSAASGSRPIKLENFVALNDEIAALVRAGIPLDVGLRGFAAGVSGELSAISQRLADRLAAGETLVAALQAEGTTVPSAYRAAVEVGLTSGRLTQATETLANAGRALLELRRAISLSLIYPAAILLTAYYTVWTMSTWLSEGFLRSAITPGDEPSSWMRLMQNVSNGFARLGHGPPMVFGLLLLWWWVRTSRVGNRAGLASGLVRWVPGMRDYLRSVELATFSELAGVLLESGSDSQSAMSLAAAATGNPALQADVDRLAALIAEGKRLCDDMASVRSFPPLMRWMLAAGERQGALPATFRQVSKLYENRAQRRGDWIAILFPLTLCGVVGGAVVLLCSLTLAVPYSEFLKALGSP